VNRDIVVKVMLNPEEFLGLAHIAEEAGLSHSAQVRAWIKKEIIGHALRVLAAQQQESTKPGHD
jgi:hypothetical protein